MGDPEVAERLDRIGKLMALTLVAEMTTEEKRRTLAAVGYSAGEIATLLNEKLDTIQKFLKREREATEPRRTKAPPTRPRKR